MTGTSGIAIPRNPERNSIGLTTGGKHVKKDFREKPTGKRAKKRIVWREKAIGGTKNVSQANVLERVGR